MITEETIQEKAAFQIAMGIMQFLHSPSFNPQSISPKLKQISAKLKPSSAVLFILL